MTRNTFRTGSTLLCAMLLAAGVASAQPPSASGSAATSGSVTGTGSQAARGPALTAPTTPAAAGMPAAPATLAPDPALPPLSGGVPPAAPGIAPQAAAPAAMANQIPARTDTAAAAFRTLDPTNRGYVTRADMDRIPGFFGFDHADANRDGQLSAEEFQNAWSYYSP